MEATAKKLTVNDLLQAMKEGSSENRTNIFFQLAECKGGRWSINLKEEKLETEKIPPIIVQTTGDVIENRDTDPKIVTAALIFLSTLPEDVVPDEVVDKIKSLIQSEDPAILMAAYLAFANIRHETFIHNLATKYHKIFDQCIKDMM